MIDRIEGSLIGIKRMRIQGRSGFPEINPTHVYINKKEFFELQKFANDMAANPKISEKWIKFVFCRVEYNMSLIKQNVHKNGYSDVCSSCTKYIDNLSDKSIWWFEVDGSESLLKISFKRFVDGYTSTCSCLYIIAVGTIVVQLSFDRDESYKRRSFRVVN